MTTFPTIRSLAAAIALAVIGGCGPEPLPEFELSGNTMGTTYSVVIVDPDRSGLDAIGSGIQAELDSIDARFSTWDTSSDISTFNLSGSTEWESVSAEFCSGLVQALELAERTGGAFDPTVGVLVDLWGFMAIDRQERIPSPEQINSALSSSGYHKVETDCAARKVRKSDPGIYIDLSGFAKGLAVDRVAESLAATGAVNYLVEIGGEVRAQGLNGSLQPWRVAIESPDSSVHSIIGVSSRSVASSGDYRNYFEVDGVRYAHIIDSNSGYPVRHDTAAVTVLDESAATADALATALLVMGSSRGTRFANDHGIAALFIDRADRGYTALPSREFVNTAN